MIPTLKPNPDVIGKAVSVARAAGGRVGKAGGGGLQGLTQQLREQQAEGEQRLFDTRSRPERLRSQGNANASMGNMPLSLPSSPPPNPNGLLESNSGGANVGQTISNLGDIGNAVSNATGIGKAPPQRQSQSQPQGQTQSQGSQQPTASGSSCNPATGWVANLNSSARGVKNNNPGNLESNAWTSKLPGYVGSDGRFAIFDSPESGIAAIDQNLQGYGKQGISTPLAIASRWAPGSERGNNPNSYGAVIAKHLGVDPNASIDMSDPGVRSKIAEAIGLVENGPAPQSPAAQTAMPTALSAPPAAPAAQQDPSANPSPDNQDPTALRRGGHIIDRAVKIARRARADGGGFDMSYYDVSNPNSPYYTPPLALPKPSALPIVTNGSANPGVTASGTGTPAISYAQALAASAAAATPPAAATPAAAAAPTGGAGGNNGGYNPDLLQPTFGDGGGYSGNQSYDPLIADAPLPPPRPADLETNNSLASPSPDQSAQNSNVNSVLSAYNANTSGSKGLGAGSAPLPPPRPADLATNNSLTPGSSGLGGGLDPSSAPVPTPPPRAVPNDYSGSDPTPKVTSTPLPGSVSDITSGATSGGPPMGPPSPTQALAAAMAPGPTLTPSALDEAQGMQALRTAMTAAAPPSPTPPASPNITLDVDPMQFDTPTPAAAPPPARVVTPDDGSNDSAPVKVENRITSNPDGSPIGELAPPNPAGNANVAPTQISTGDVSSGLSAQSMSPAQAQAFSVAAQQQKTYTDAYGQSYATQAEADAGQDKTQDSSDGSSGSSGGSDGSGGGGENKRGGYIKPKRAGGGNVEAALAMLRRKSKASSDKSNVVNKALKIVRRS